MKKILTLLLLLFILPICFGNQQAFVHQSTTLWASTSSVPVTTANMTIYFPNGTVGDTHPMTSAVNVSATKVFYHLDYVPNVSGNYLYLVTFYNGATIKDVQTETFYVAEDSEMYLTLLFGLLALILLCFWYARSMAGKPVTAVNVWILNEVTTKDFAVIFDLIGGFLILPLLALLQIWSTGTQYATIFSSIYTAGFYFIGFMLFGYLVFYLIYRYNEGIENIHDRAYGKRR